MLLYLIPLSPCIMVLYYLLTSKELFDTGLALGACLAVVALAAMLITYANRQSTCKDADGGDSRHLFDNVSLDDIIDKIRLKLTEANETVQILNFLRKRIHKNKKVAVDLAAKNDRIVYFILKVMEELNGEDERVLAGIDVINELLHVQDAKDIILSTTSKSMDTIKYDIIDPLVAKIKELVAQNRVRFTRDEYDADLDDISLKLNLETRDEAASSLSGSKKQCFTAYGYKFVMALGLLAMDHPGLQTIIGDRGGIEVTVRFMDEYYQSFPTLAKWSCWSLIHITLQHPPNKRELANRNGIETIINALKHNPEKSDLHSQAYMLLVNVLSNDNKTKMSLAKARQLALTNGLVDVIQSAQRTFVKVDDIQSSTKFILDLLIADWS